MKCFQMNHGMFKCPLMIRYPSASTILRYLTANLYKKRVAALKAPLKVVHKKARYEFASKWLVNGQNMLGNVIWTDETWVASHPNNRKTSHWTTSKIVKVKEKQHSGGNSVTFWGCISQKGRGPLVALECYLNGEKYVEILQDELFKELKAAQELFPGVWRVQQDNAPCHKYRAGC